MKNQSRVWFNFNLKAKSMKQECLISYAYGYGRPDLKYGYRHIQVHHLAVRLEQYASYSVVSAWWLLPDNARLPDLLLSHWSPKSPLQSALRLDAGSDKECRFLRDQCHQVEINVHPIHGISHGNYRFAQSP